MILSIAVGAVNGYALSFWRVKGANLLFGILLLGAFIPYQVMLYPLVRIVLARSASTARCPASSSSTRSSACRS